MSEEQTPETPVDNAANLCGWLIAVTGLLLLIAIHTMQTTLADQYNVGWYKH
jgi:hypothetical protein